MNNKIVGPCGVYSGAVAEDEIDLDLFLYRILLFDEYILKSNMLMDLAYLINAFGFDFIYRLIDQKMLKIYLSQTMLGFWNIEPHPLICRDGEVQYYFSPLVVSLPERDKFLENAVSTFVKSSRSSAINNSRILYKIEDSILFFPEKQHSWLNFAVKHDYSVYAEVFKLALIEEVIKSQKNPMFFGGIRFDLIEIDNRVHCIKCNEKLFYGLSQKEIEAMLFRVVNRVANLNVSYLEMDCFDAVYGFDDDDAKLFMLKNKILRERVLSKTIEENFERVVKIANLPKICDRCHMSGLDIENFFKIKQSDEFKEFRMWLAGVGDLADDEISSIIQSKKLRIFNFLSSKIGNVFRFIVTTGFGMVPGLDIAGIALSAVDAFALDRIVKTSKVVSFLNNTYPTMIK